MAVGDSPALTTFGRHQNTGRSLFLSSDGPPCPSLSRYRTDRARSQRTYPDISCHFPKLDVPLVLQCSVD